MHNKILVYHGSDHIIHTPVYLGGKELNEYEFSTDWYFFGGDNVMNSKDSRYIGLVPEDYIIGIVTRILFSKNPDEDSIKWNRFMKRTE